MLLEARKGSQPLETAVTGGFGPETAVTGGFGPLYLVARNQKQYILSTTEPFLQSRKWYFNIQLSIYVHYKINRIFIL